MLEATISLHRSVCAKFLPTAIKFYYGFNLRDLSCLVQVSPTPTPTPTRALQSVFSFVEWSMYHRGETFSFRGDLLTSTHRRVPAHKQV